MTSAPSSQEPGAAALSQEPLVLARIGERVRRVRASRGMTRKALGEQARNAIVQALDA